MNWRPSDLVGDQDLLAYEANILTQFGPRTSWRDRLDRATEDWLLPQLEAAGFSPQQLRTRLEPKSVLGFTSSAYTDRTSSATSSGNTADVPLATIFATPASDLLYVGSDQPFRGLWLNLLDNVSAVAATVTVKAWTGTWQTLTVSDGTSVSGATFGKGGTVSWVPPTEWSERFVNTSVGPYYWVRVSTSATPTSGTACAQVGCVTSSRLRAPLTLRTLALIFREAPVAQDGPWEQKAIWYEQQADLALSRVLPLIGGEFDTNNSELLDSDEQTTTAAELTENAGFRLERA